MGNEGEVSVARRGTFGRLFAEPRVLSAVRILMGLVVFGTSLWLWRAIPFLHRSALRTLGAVGFNELPFVDGLLLVIGVSVAVAAYIGCVAWVEAKWSRHRLVPFLAVGLQSAPCYALLLLWGEGDESLRAFYRVLPLLLVFLAVVTCIRSFFLASGETAASRGLRFRIDIGLRTMTLMLPCWMFLLFVPIWHLFDFFATVTAILSAAVWSALLEKMHDRSEERQTLSTLAIVAGCVAACTFIATEDHRAEVLACERPIAECWYDIVLKKTPLDPNPS